MNDKYSKLMNTLDGINEKISYAEKQLCDLKKKKINLEQKILSTVMTMNGMDFKGIISLIESLNSSDSERKSDSESIEGNTLSKKLTDSTIYDTTVDNTDDIVIESE